MPYINNSGNSNIINITNSAYTSRQGYSPVAVHFGTTCHSGIWIHPLQFSQIVIEHHLQILAKYSGQYKYNVNTVCTITDLKMTELDSELWQHISRFKYKAYIDNRYLQIFIF